MGFYFLPFLAVLLFIIFPVQLLVQSTNKI